jgi:hypothetical protein
MTERQNTAYKGGSGVEVGGVVMIRKKRYLHLFREAHDLGEEG